MAAGIGWYLGIDPTVIRILLVVLTIGTGMGVPLYIVAWIVMPVAGAGEARTAPAPRDTRSLALIGLAIAAAVLLVRQVDLFSTPVMLAAVLIGIGILLFKDGDTPWRQQPATPTGPPQPPAGDTRQPHASHEPDPSTGPHSTGPQSAYTSYAAAWRTPPPPPPPRPKRPKTILGRLAVGTWLTILGATALLDRLGVVNLSLARAIALAIGTAGVFLVIGTLFGRARWLIPVGILSTLLLVPPVVLGSDYSSFGGQMGENSITVSDLDGLAEGYDWFLGEQTLDFGLLDLAGKTRPLSATITAGQMIIIVPDDATVQVRGTIQGGEYDILGEHGSGTDLDFDFVFDGAEDAGRLNLNLDATFGSVTVLRGEQR